MALYIHDTIYNPTVDSDMFSFSAAENNNTACMPGMSQGLSGVTTTVRIVQQQSFPPIIAEGSAQNAFIVGKAPVKHFPQVPANGHVLLVLTPLVRTTHLVIPYMFLQL